MTKHLFPDVPVNVYCSKSTQDDRPVENLLKHLTQKPDSHNAVVYFALELQKTNKKPQHKI